MVLDWSHEAVFEMIHSGSSVSKAAATATTSHKTIAAAIAAAHHAVVDVVIVAIAHTKGGFLGVGGFLVQTEELLVLFDLQVSGPVDCEAESSLSLAILLLVVVVDLVLVFVVALLLCLKFGCVAHILVVLSGELEEFRVVVKLVLASGDAAEAINGVAGCS